jgi:hypothetical protein
LSWFPEIFQFLVKILCNSKPALLADLLHMGLSNHSEKMIINLKIKENLKTKFQIPTNIKSSQLVLCYRQLHWSHWVNDECFPTLNFVNIYLPQIKWCPQNKVKVNVLIEKNKRKNRHLLKGSMCLGKGGGGKNESCIGIKELSHPENAWFHLHSFSAELNTHGYPGPNFNQPTRSLLIHCRKKMFSVTILLSTLE